MSRRALGKVERLFAGHLGNAGQRLHDSEDKGRIHPRCESLRLLPIRVALGNLSTTSPVSLVTILSGCEINNFAGQSAKSVCYNLVAMFDLFRLWLGAVLRGFRT